MKKTVYLHIGSGKTGTTSIQFMLHENKEKLLENGYLYSTKDYLLEPNHHNLVSVPFDDLMWDRDVKEYKDLLDIFENSTATTMIISTEKLIGAPRYYIDNLKSIFIEYDVKIIVYVRNQIDLLPSVFLQRQQDLTADYKNDFSNFYKYYKNVWGNDSKIIIENWLPVFGVENILVRVYDKEILLDGDVCMDFSTMLGINTYIAKTTFHKNSSLIPEISSLISIIDKLIPRLTVLNSADFIEMRQKTLMQCYLMISDKYKHNEIDKAIIGLNTIANILHTNFPKINSLSLYKIFIEIYKVQESFQKRNKYDLMNLEEKQQILDYYKESNKMLSDIFLNKKEAEIFLKYYS